MAAPTFFEGVDEVRFRLTGFEGATVVVVDVVCFGLPLMVYLLVDVSDAAEAEGVGLNCCAVSTDCDLVCSITASFPSGIAAPTVGIGSV